MTAIQGVALVTGSGAGLGRACALTLGKRGARVAVHCMKSREGADEVVQTLKAAGTDARGLRECGERLLLGRAGTPDEVAGVVAFLALADASFLTGETIEINGGMNMR
jgi:NAD(P)-dependent dehydrogenase (short-subunit alcohol dehydrogenase family)